jgi:hypothetical protein
MGNRNCAAPLLSLFTFGALLITAASNPQAGASRSSEIKSTSNLGGQVPASFDQDVASVVAEIDRIEAETLSEMKDSSLDRQGQVRTLGKLLLFDKNRGQSERGVQFLPYARDGIHRANPIFESDNCVVSRIGQSAVQQSEAAKLHVRALCSGAPLQCTPG